MLIRINQIGCLVIIKDFSLVFSQSLVCPPSIVSPLSSLHCAVCIPASYPKQPPTLALLVESGGNKLPFSLETKDLEKELNLGFHDLIKDDASGSKLLLRQLLKAQVENDPF